MVSHHSSLRAEDNSYGMICAWLAREDVHDTSDGQACGCKSTFSGALQYPNAACGTSSTSTHLKEQHRGSEDSNVGDPVGPDRLDQVMTSRSRKERGTGGTFHLPGGFPAAPASHLSPGQKAISEYCFSVGHYY